MSFDAPAFARHLLAWYQSARRDLPWRRTHDPYAILVSELMLQQTQVKTVIPYFQRFMNLFPTPRDLALAEETEVLKAWEGLGYYRRVRHLREAARQIYQDHDNRFPQDKTAIDNLKGVGAYTSAAVASIAFNMPYACVDGNVIRVITRLHGLDDDVVTAAAKKKIQHLADTMLDTTLPGDFNQGMMELGATICTPREPSCLACPVNAFCTTRQNGDDPQSRPVKTKKVRVKQADFDALFLYRNGAFLLCRRPAEGLMADMWELPAKPREDTTPWPALMEGAVVVHAKLPDPFVHRFTHIHARYFVTVCAAAGEVSFLNSPANAVSWRWFTPDELADVPTTRVLKKKLPILTTYLQENPPCQASTSTLPGM